MDTGYVENILRQRLNEDGNNGECVGHEMWSPDGRGMYFIKYISTTILPRGVWYLDVYTRKAGVLLLVMITGMWGYHRMVICLRQIHKSAGIIVM